MTVNFKLVSPFSLVQRRSFTYGTPAELKPTDANPLVDGEWLELDSDYKADRGTGDAAVPSFPVFAETGRYDTQALGQVPLLYLGAFEADTLVYTATGLAVGDPVYVGDVTAWMGGSLTKRGLLDNGASAGLTVGYVTRIVSGGYMRFIRTLS